MSISILSHFYIEITMLFDNRNTHE